jgi:hypothetical protein
VSSCGVVVMVVARRWRDDLGRHKRGSVCGTDAFVDLEQAVSPQFSKLEYLFLFQSSTLVV